MSKIYHSSPRKSIKLRAFPVGITSQVIVYKVYYPLLETSDQNSVPSTRSGSEPPCRLAQPHAPAEIESLHDVVVLQFVDGTGGDDDLAVDYDVTAIGDADRLVEVLFGHQHGQ